MRCEKRSYLPNKVIMSQHINVKWIPHSMNIRSDISSSRLTPIARLMGANIGSIWGRQDPGGSHVGPMNFAIWEVLISHPGHAARSQVTGHNGRQQIQFSHVFFIDLIFRAFPFIEHPITYQLMWPGDTYVRKWAELFVQLMVCRLFGAKLFLNQSWFFLLAIEPIGTTLNKMSTEVTQIFVKKINLQLTSAMFSDLQAT